jgi:hypothetical protein
MKHQLSVDLVQSLKDLRATSSSSSRGRSSRKAVWKADQADVLGVF